MGFSIGPIGNTTLPVASERRKTFLTTVVTSKNVDDFFVAKMADEIARLYRHDEATRLSVRAVATNDAVGKLNTEAVIPVNDRVSIVYVGHNKPPRQLSTDEARGLLLARGAAKRKYGPNGGPDVDYLARGFRAAQQKGYSISIAVTEAQRSTLVDNHIGEISALLKKFDYTRDQTEAIIQDESNIIGVAKEPGGRVVAIEIADTVTINLKGYKPFKRLMLAELTDASVDDGHVGSGLQVLIAARLIQALVVLPTPPHVIFSESVYNGSLSGAARTGRTFVGRLPNHAVVEEHIHTHEGAEHEYASLEVTHISIETAAKLAQDLDAALRT